MKYLLYFLLLILVLISFIAIIEGEYLAAFPALLGATQIIWGLKNEDEDD
jgi:hypothetical protein